MKSCKIINLNEFLKVILLTAMLLLPSQLFSENMIFTFRSPESKTDKRYDYDNDLLKLALEKTKPNYGDYTIKYSGVMNYARAIKWVGTNKFPNFFIKLSYLDSLTEEMNLAFVPFPVDLGIVGYRVCFTNSGLKKELENIRSLKDLRKYRHGQGRGWGDVEILRKNSFEVHEVSKYESLFRMVAKNRFDLFCRGTNELLGEWESRKQIENLVYDQSFSLAYPLPRFFYTNKSNQKALKRVSEGLVIAFNDGSLKKLWRANYQKSIEFVKLENRRIFRIENPFLKNIKVDYKKYFFNPTNK